MIHELPHGFLSGATNLKKEAATPLRTPEGLMKRAEELHQKARNLINLFGTPQSSKRGWDSYSQTPPVNLDFNEQSIKLIIEGMKGDRYMGQGEYSNMDIVAINFLADEAKAFVNLDFIDYDKEYWTISKNSGTTREDESLEHKATRNSSLMTTPEEYNEASLILDFTGELLQQKLGQH